MKKIYIFRTVLIVFILSFFVINTSYANKYYVSPTGNNSDGSSWTNGYTDLQGALGAVIAEDTIYIKQGVYIPHASDNSVSFAMIQDLEIYGGFSGSEMFGDANFMENRDFELYEVVLSGDINADDDGFTNNTENTLHIITSSVTGVIIDGVTISGGNGGEDFGGASKITGGDITFNNVIFKNNIAKYGGAISFASSSFVISNSVFYDNTTTYSGGAIYNNGSNGTFTNTNFIENYNTFDTYNSQVYYGIGTATIDFINTILWNETNTSGDYVWDGVQTLNYSYSLIKNSSSNDWDTDFGTDGGNNIENYPWLANQTNFELFDNSAAIGSGNITDGSNIGYYQGAGIAMNEVFVKADASGLNDGTSWTNAYSSLKIALENSSYGSKIFVAKGTYIPHASQSDSSFTIRKGIELYGGFAGNEYPIDQTELDNRDFETNETILSGDLSGNDDGFTNNSENSWHVMEVNSLDVEIDIDGFTVSGGNGDYGSSDNDKGAGIYIYASKVNLNNMVFSYNNADYYGGAIYTYNSTCTFSNLFLNNNEGGLGGSTFYLNYGNVTIYNVTATENGIDGNNNFFYNQFCTTDIINTIFWANYDTYSSSDTYVTISNSLIQGCGESGAEWNTAWGADGGNNYDEFPYFANYKENDVRLLANSVANGSGDVTYGSNMGYYQGTAIPVPDPLYVKADASGTGDGADWTNAFTSLSDAIDQAITSQKIYVAKGTYYPHASDRSVAYNLKEHVEVYGGFIGNEGSIDQTVIDNRDLETNKTILSGDIDTDGTLGGNSYNVFDIRDVDSTAVLDGFEISGGYAVGLFENYEDRGAGIFVYKATPVLRNLQIIENYAKYGGGIYLYTSSPDLINISIYNNDVSDAGSGIYYYWYSSPEIQNMIIYYNADEDNQAYVGTYCDPDYTNSIVTGSGGSTAWNTDFGIDSGNNLDTIPYAKDPYNGDYKLLTASPALNSGNATYGNNIGYYQGTGEAMPDPIFVKADASGGLDGTNWTDAFADLNNAINATVPFQDIYVAKGLYKPSVSDQNISFELKEWTKIYGSFNGDEIVNQTVIDNRDFENNISILSGDLDGDDDGFDNNTENSFNVIRANDLSEFTLIDGFQISYGNGDGDVPYNNGGGVFCKNSNTVFKNLKITNNQTRGRAGGFYNDGGAPKISNVTISNNNSTWIAGGFANVSAKNPILTNVIIWGNTCDDEDYPEYNEMQLLSASISFENSNVPESGGSTDWQAGFGIDLGGNIDTIPHFVSYEDNDIRLLDISPALSAGKIGVGTNIGFYQGVGIVTPDITITESLTDFGEIGVDLKSSEQSYTVSGSDLMDDLLIIAPAEFELSLTSDDYTGNTDTLTLTPTLGTIPTTTIYVRFGPTTGGVKLDSISHLSYGLPNLDTVRVSGTGAAPEMVVDNSTESFGSIIMHEYSDEVSYTVSAVFLTDNMIITAPTGFEITETSGDYSGNTSEITLVPVSGTIASTDIYVRFAPVNEQYYSGNISHTTVGLSTINKFVNGTGFHAPLYYVSADALGNEDGANWDNAFTSLASALIEVTSGDTIVVAKGTYIPSIFSRTETFEMVAGVKIFGGFEGTEEINVTTIENRDFETNETILSGDLYGNDEFVGNTENSYTVVLFDAWDAAFSSTTILDGFTISGGNSNGASIEYYRGGGIYMQVGYIDDCSPTLRNLVIKDNTARHGGGIYMDGIVDAYSTNATTLENVQFIDNYAFYASSAGGGAIYMSAVPNSSCEPSFTDITFINNSSAQNGGGIYMSGGYVGGPGIVSPTITNATFYGSTCVTNWGTAVHINAQEGLADPVFNNVIFYGNDEVQIRSYATSGTSSPSYNHCLITGSPSTSWNTEIGINSGGNIEGDPLFVDADNANVSVFDNSPVIGVGDATYGPNIGYYQGVGLAAPEVLVVSGLTGFGTIETGNSSEEQSFTVSGTDLIEDIVITPPVGFELTLTSGSGYINEITLSPTTGTIVTTTVYVRFTPTVIGDHSDNITVNSTGVAEQLIAVTAYAGGAPEISFIADQSICSSNDLFVGFTVTDDDLSTISFDVTTTDEAVLPVANTSITGSDGTYSLNITPLNAGTVDVKVYVTDAVLNTDSTSFNLVIVPGPAISVDFSQITCANYNDAELVVSSTGGTGVITYQLNNGGYGFQTTFDGLWEGQYTIVAQDESGCTDTSDVYEVINPDYLYGSVNLESPIICHNDNDAIITVQAYGGWGDYEFSIDGETFQSDTSFENLGEGYYNIYVRDASGCYEYVYDIEIYNPEELILEDIYLTDPSGGDNGSISVYAYGGTYPLMYALNDGEYQMDSYFNYLSQGEYTVYVQDANGCSLSEVVNLFSTGFNTEVLNLDLKLYPNPASDFIYFDISQISDQLEAIEIHDLSGKKQIIENQEQALSGKISLSNINKGIYILIFKMHNKIAYKKIIIN